MSDRVWLILLQAVYRSGSLFLKDGVRRAMEVLEEHQEFTAKDGNGRDPDRASIRSDTITRPRPARRSTR